MKRAMLVIYFLSVALTLANFGMQVEAKGHGALHNKHLKVAAEHWSPFFIVYCNEKMVSRVADCPDKENITYDGVLWEFLNMVKHARNVTFSILSPPNNTWGYCHTMNNCTGMIGIVNRKEVDFALGKFPVSSDEICFIIK